MKRTSFFRYFISLVLILTCLRSFGINTTDTRMMQQPAASARFITFVYDNDLWRANIDGSNPVRITTDEGVESTPFFSPDGKMIAFSAEYDGNTDVFLIPVEGGIPIRLTWHPSADIVRGFTPDGKSVLFASGREDYSGRYSQLYTVTVSGGFPQKLAIPNAYQGVFSPDGKSLAYCPISPAYRQWKNYRGGTVSTIWLFSLSDNTVVRVPQPEGKCNDSDPMWIGDKIFFRSDRNGEFNLFSYNTGTKEIKQLTFFKDFPVYYASAGNNTLIFEQAGYLHTLNLQTGDSKKLTLSIAADLQELRPRFIKGSRYIRRAWISPSGARAVVDFRGEIITLPAEKGDPRNITNTTGIHEQFPSWSPDGKSIAYLSDESGEYMLHIQPQDGKGETKKFPLSGTGFYAFPEWSPDSKFITYSDNGRNFWALELITGKIRKIDSDDLYTPGPFRRFTGQWSADSKWLTYTKVTRTGFNRIFIYASGEGKSYPVTDGMSNTDDPVFDPEGKYILFFASTDAGPVINWFDLSSQDMRMTNSIYLVTLRKDIPNPFARISDEEKGKEEKGKGDGTGEGSNTLKEKKGTGTGEGEEKGKEEGTKDPKAGEKEKSVSIDFEGMDNRIVAVPLKAGSYEQLGMTKADELLYVDRAPGSSSGKLFKYDMKERKESEVMELDNYLLSADRKKMLYSKGETMGICDAAKKPEAGKGTLNTGALEVKVDPVSEWRQIFNEAWRINRDYFYDPGMHGTNWLAMKEKYESFLPDVECRNDLNRLIMWMCSELSVGHHRVGGGDQLREPLRVGGGLLGADYEIANNRYRLKKIYGGLNWNPNLRSPLTEPGINTKKGEYILAVNGKNVTADDNLYSFFENTAGKITELTLGPNADGTGSRIVNVEPIGNEFNLRNRDWVEGNLRKVTEATNGRVAYVYVPNTSAQGHEYFKRYFFPQADREAVIIDERFNGGGLIADYYIDILNKPVQSYWNMRYGMDLKTPGASIQGPKVMIIDETAGSGGDMLPWMFRKFKVGTLVGKTTWGGLVGTLGFPELMDGGGVTAPNLAIWTKDGFVVENVGVAPDIEVEMWPAEVNKGKDPQLEKAIEVIMDQLKKNPQEKPERPPYPVKVRK
jgi:tricorn protease